MNYEWIKGGGYPLKHCIPPHYSSMKSNSYHQDLAVPLDLVIIMPYQSHMKPISQTQPEPTILVHSESEESQHINIKPNQNRYDPFPVLEDERFQELLERTQVNSHTKTKEISKSNAPKTNPKKDKKRTQRKRNPYH